MTAAFSAHIEAELAAVKQAGLYKAERVITSPQGAHIAVSNGQDVHNFCDGTTLLGSVHIGYDW